jgi:hypothetical protein
MHRFIAFVLILTAAAGFPQTPRIDSAGPIRSTSGGYIFPDGTTQTSAAISAAPGSITTAMIADGAITEAKLAASLALGSGIQRVVRGVVTIDATKTVTDVRKSFSPAINPEKSIVLLSAPVFSRIPGSGDYDPTRLGAAVIELESNSITVAVDYPFGTSNSQIIYPCRVSFQIIEFR